MPRFIGKMWRPKHIKTAMTPSILWWALTGLAIVLQLLTGTFHFLLLALGFAAGAVAAQLGLDLVWQVLGAALGGGGSVMLWYVLRRGQPAPLPAGSNPDVSQDVGGLVNIDAWNPDGSASTFYRGAHWSAIHQPNSPPEPGAHRIIEVVGSRLLVEKIQDR